MITPVRRWLGFEPKIQAPQIADVVAAALRKRSTRRIMLEAADLIESWGGGQTDRALATVLRERATLIGQEGGPHA